VTVTSMSVPAPIDELATSSLTTKLAKGLIASKCQFRRVRVTNSRDARGAVGCAASRSRSTTRLGVASTADTAENMDSVTMR